MSPHYFWYQTTLNSPDSVAPGVHILVLHLLLLSMAVWVIVFLLMTFEVNHSVVVSFSGCQRVWSSSDPIPPGRVFFSLPPTQAENQFWGEPPPQASLE